QSVPVGGFLSTHPHRYSTNGVYMHPISLSRFFFDILNVFWAVHHRVCVCHTCHRSDTPSGSGSSTSENIFLVGENGIPEMDVHIHKSRTDNKASGIQYHIGLCLNVFFHLYNATIFSKNV